MKITDAVLQEFLELQSVVKEKQKRIDEIKVACLEKGSFATSNHVCSVTQQTSRRLAGLEEVVSVVGLSVLEQNNLINSTTYKIVKVTKKIC